MNALAKDKLHNDPRLAEAKRLFKEAMEGAQNQLKGIRPSDPARKESYDTLLADYGRIRGADLWFRFLGSGIGNGTLVELLDGSVKYDFIGSIGVHLLGHNHPALVEAAFDAACSDTIMQGNLQQNSDAVTLSKKLAMLADKDHCFLSTSGVIANENALKVALQKRFPAQRILAFEGCFAGRTLAISQITDKPQYREGLPANILVDYIPFYDAKRPNESINEAVSTLKKHLKRYPGEYAAAIFELVQGERGAIPGDGPFFQAIMEVLKEHQVLIIMDEVQTFARTPELFAFQYFGLEEYADIVTIGKTAQVCATLFNSDLNPRPGLLAQTFTSSTAAIRGSIALLDELTHGGYYGPEGKIEQLHTYFAGKLEQIRRRHPDYMDGPYGIGAMIAFTPFDGQMKEVVAYTKALFEAGVMSFVAGQNPTRCRMLIPAGAVTHDDIDAATEIIERTLKACT